MRQLVLAGEGNGGALVVVAGLTAGGALAHTLGIASSPAGVTDAGRVATSLGLLVALAYAGSIVVPLRRATSGLDGEAHGA